MTFNDTRVSPKGDNLIEGKNFEAHHLAATARCSVIRMFVLQDENALRQVCFMGLGLHERAYDYSITIPKTFCASSIIYS